MGKVALPPGKKIAVNLGVDFDVSVFGSEVSRI